MLTPGGERGCDSAALKKLYNEGIRMGEYEVYLKATDQYVLLRFILSGNPENGHIMSHGFCYDITEAKKEDIKQKSREKEAALVFNVLSEEYLNIYIVNPEDASMEVRKQDGFLLEDEENGSRRRYSYNDSWWKYVDSCVPEEEKEAVYRTGCFERVNEELKSKDEYVFNYKSSYGGLHNLQIRVVRMDDGRFILGARNIDELLAEEARQRELLEGALLAAEQSNRAKTRFLNNMSHDIRTPMNAIIGFTTLASSHIDDKEKVTDYLDKIRMSSKHLLNLINDVLDMSRIEAGKVEIEESEVNLAEMIEDIHNIVQADANAKGLSVSFDTSGLQDEYVWCDRLRFDQALLNCISNAIKFTPEQGKIEIIAAQKPCDTEGCATYEMKIRDTGIGMSPDFVKNIFEPFERERTSTVSGTQGTGLGMAITKNLFNMMGGTIEVQSTQNVGTEITIRLTLRKAETAAAGGTGAVEQGGAPEQTLEGLKILLVEDNELNREIAVDFLSEMGAVLDSAENGAEALEKVRTAAAGTYEIILMDVQMPVMDGYEATRQIRALPDRELAAIPIIAMTANAFEEDRHNAEEAGMNGHIPKPIEIDVVIRTVSEVKNRRS